MADYTVLKMIAGNDTAKVYVVKHKETEELFVLKCYMNQAPKEIRDKEISIMTTFDSPFLMNLIYTFELEGHLLMPYCSGGNLLSRIQ